MRIIRKNLNVLILILSLLVVNTAMAQQSVLSGKVTDSSTGESLPGVSIVVKGTTTGTVSDLDGNFTLQTADGAVVQFSFVGYKPQEIIAQGQTNLAVALEVDNAELEEVVVIGYGQVRKGDATGALTTVSSKDFNKGAITTAQDLLVGKSAGVVITTAGGAPGSGATIRIRGGSSLNASNDPLIVIDGVPISNENVAGSSNFLSFINPNDIETFTILKDASSTAIYGARASNGVILITTKKGTAGSLMKLTYDGNTSVASVPEFVDVYSGDEIRQIALEHKDLFGVESLNMLGDANTNWQKEIYRNAISHDHNISLSGSYKILPYRISVGYTDQQGILKNTDMKRLTGAVSLNPILLNGDLKVNMNGKWMSTKHNFGDDGAVGSAINMDPTHPVKDGNPLSAGYFQWENYGASLGTSNPVEQLLASDNKADVDRFIGNVQLDYKIPFIPDLHANLNLGTDYTTSTGHNNRPTTSPSTLTNPLAWGKLTDFHGKNYNDLLDFYLNYVKEISGISSKIDATAGYSWQHFKRTGDNYTRGIVDADHPYQMSDSTAFATESYILSFFGRLNYTFLDRFILTASLRNDYSSRFLKSQRSGIFPSVAFAWKINDESFLKNSNTISNLKLRLGWGITGQQDVLNNDYPAQARYLYSFSGNYYPIGGTFLPTLRPNAYDPYIKWEETTTQNIALDYGFFKDRIYGSLDLYKRVSDDLLNKVNIPSGSNFSNTLFTNVGSLENKGVEFSLNVVPISKSDMSLTLGFNLTYNHNEITKLLISDDPKYIGVLYGDGMTGSKQVTRVGHPAYSFFVNKQVYGDDGYPVEGLYVDLSGQGGAVNGDNLDKYIYKNPAPDYLMGFSARFDYKNFDISASSRASIGNYAYNQVFAGSSYDQMYQIGYWKNFPTNLSDTKFVKRQFTSDYFVENASYFKLDNISAGYRIENISGKMSARISLTAQNVFTITKYSGVDPEVSYRKVADTDNVPGIDNNSYPRPRIFMLGLNLTF